MPNRKSDLKTPLAPLVYILVLNWNSYNDTLECINSLQEIKYPNFRIVIIDNGSVTNDINNIRKILSNIELLKSKENLGFSGGNNLGIKYAMNEGADFVLLLNNDTIVEPDFLNYLIADVVTDKKIGMAVPKINYYSNHNIVWYAGGYTSEFRGSAFTIGQGQQSNRHASNKFVSFATGCCMLIKREVIERVGYWDENYFLYMEDADYCKRAINSGFKILFASNSQIFHKVNAATTKNDKNLPLYYMVRNRLYFSKKLLQNKFFIAYTYIFVTVFIKSLIWLIKGEMEKIKTVKLSFSDFKLRNMGKRKVK